MRIVWVLSVSLLGSATVACGDSGSSGSGGGGTTSSTGSSQGDPNVYCSPPGQDCTGVDEYVTCATTQCDAEYKQCLGADYQNGNFGGDCGAYIDCAKDCCNGCDCDSTCQQNCDSLRDQVCTDCFTAVASCITANCTLPDCGQSTTTGGGGFTCEDLDACCASLETQEDRDACVMQRESSMGLDQSCDVMVKTYQASMLCLSI